MPPTPSTATFSFPPLPPLPPYSLGGNHNRRSAPPTTQPVVLAQSVRVRGRRSRVSFREDVDIADECRVRSTSRPRSGPPTASTSGPSVSIADRLQAAQRRSSADSFHLARKPQLAPRPVLKRASSSQPLAPIKAGRDNCDFFDAFCAQALRYPKLSPALARLSDGSIPSPSAWSQQYNRKSSVLTASPTALVPVAPSSSASSPSTSSPSTSSGGGPARKARPPRSPIPSWSSAVTSCPSLVSSHRASMISTLTAPSVTSLLLSPPSPVDHFALMPSPGFVDDGALHSPHYSPRRTLGRDMADDVPGLDTKGRGMMPMYSPTVYMMHGQPLAESPDNEVGADDENPKRNSRIRPRRSDPVSLSSSSDGSPSLSPPPPPRATQRLLKLQSSLADLRMQRRAEEEKQAAAAEAQEARRSARTTSTLPSPRPRAPSPTLGDLVRRAPRDQMLSTDLEDLDSGDESDLDLSLPPLNAALRSHIIPSSSRLLVAPKTGRSADAEANDDGWSGSDSEEEEFSRTVARIDLRKTTVTSPATRLLKRPSLPASRVSRYSDFGASGELPSSPSTGSDRSAPSIDSSSIASRRSTASSVPSGRATGTAALINALVEQKYASTGTLPRPKRFVEGWGAPEVLEDDEWPPDNAHGLETLAEAW